VTGVWLMIDVTIVGVDKLMYL